MKDRKTAKAKGNSDQVQKKPFRVKAFPLGLMRGIDPNGFNKLVDQLEVEAFLEKERRVNRQRQSVPEGALRTEHKRSIKRTP
jgi:hypothetical protein